VNPSSTVRAPLGASFEQRGSPGQAPPRWVGLAAAVVCAAGFAALCLGRTTEFLAMSLVFLGLSLLEQVRRGVSPTPPAGSLVGLACWCLAGALLSTWPGNSLSWWATGLVAFVAAWRLATFPWSVSQSGFLAVAVILCGTGVAVDAVVEFASTGSEAVSTMSHPNRLAAFIVFVWPAALAWGRECTARAVKLCAYAAACLMLAALVVTFSRGGWLGAIVQGLWLSPRRRVRFAAAILVVLVVIWMLLPWEMGGMARTFLPSYRTNLSRLSEWAAALRLVGGEPVWGVGVGNFSRATAGASLLPHNLFLHVAAQAGLGGLILSAALFRAAWRWLAARARATGQPWALAAQTALVGLMAHGMVDF
jgi:O-antigen ligase